MDSTLFAFIWKHSKRRQLIFLAVTLATLTYGLIGIAIALIYARLREIKDGVGVDDLSAVFE